jgi:hypothetical protein
VDTYLLGQVGIEKQDGTAGRLQKTVVAWEVLGSALPEGAPTGAQYLATLSDDSLQYFGSDMKALAAEAA